MEKLKGISPSSLNDFISKYGDPDMIPIAKEDQAKMYEMARPKLNIRPIGELVFFGTGGSINKDFDFKSFWEQELKDRNDAK